MRDPRLSAAFEWLRPLRHDWQCLGVDERLVCAEPSARRGDQSEWTEPIAGARSGRTVAIKGHQRRLLPLRVKLLFAVSVHGAAAAGS